MMPFKSPGTFICLMNHIFKPFSCKFLVVYFDDILVYSIDMITHLKHLRVVIEVLWRNKLYINLKKCIFL